VSRAHWTLDQAQIRPKYGARLSDLATRAGQLAAFAGCRASVQVTVL
jgi:hypothetical protein